ncbi:ABC transporter permease [Haladaptatus sp. DYF46]|uniref:ABC transporter permease n=1 Tax=Haladaptatus sp. DYF46 TaxID=2886041 RepID=UPI001E5B885B
MSYRSGDSTVRSEMAGTTTLFAAVLRKRAYLLARYPMNTLAQIVTVYLFFAAIFFGGKAAAGSIGGAGALSDTFGGLIVGWFLWTMALTAYFSLASSVTQEAQWGTLEQLYMSPYGFGSVMAASVVAYLLESMLWGAIILPLMLVTTGQSLAVDLLTVVPIVVLTLLPVVGIGFVFAGLALLYKRIENLSQLMQFVLIGLIAAPIADSEPLRYLPLVQGSSMLQRAMQGGVRLWQFPASDLAVLVVTAVGYCLLGFYAFKRAARRARRMGVLGHY